MYMQIREWAVLALRNLTEGNAENQAFLSQLEKAPREVVNAEELEKAGLRVAVDRSTGKLRVAPNPQQAQERIQEEHALPHEREPEPPESERRVV